MSRRWFEWFGYQSARELVWRWGIIVVVVLFLNLWLAPQLGWYGEKWWD